MSTVDYHAPKSTYERIVDQLAVALLVLLFVYTATNFANLPETVPTHFNIKGEIDGWGSRWFVWFLPLVAVFTFVLLMFANRFPQAMNYPVKITPDNAQRQFILARVFIRTLNMAMVVMFCLLQYVLIQMALTQTIMNMGVLILLLLLMVFAPIGVYLYLAMRAK